MNCWDPKTQPLPPEPTTFESISLCTTVMNRLHDLKETLPKNIETNKDYQGKLEFVILDYNSTDGLEQWMRENMAHHIKSGLVSFYRTTEPVYYSMTHSRNVAFKVATGRIVNNVDADNFIGTGFPHILNKLSIIQPQKALFAKGMKLLRGRIGLYEDEFRALGGYDENFIGYGCDDRDLFLRAAAFGCKLMWFGGSYVNRIKTSAQEKVKHMECKNFRQMERENKEKMQVNIDSGKIVANEGRHWGKATLTKNFEIEVKV